IERRYSNRAMPAAIGLSVSRYPVVGGGAHACFLRRSPAFVARAVGVLRGRYFGAGGVRTTVPAISGTAGRGSDEAEINRRESPNVCENKPGTGAAGVSRAGQRDDDQPSSAAVG